MKNLILLFALALVFNVSAQEEHLSNLNWLTDIDEAKTVSSKEKKPILVYFTGSDWCPPCKMLKQDFSIQQNLKKSLKIWCF